MKRRGRIVVVAVYKEPAPVDLTTLGYGELEILGTCVYTPSDFARSAGLVEQGKLDLAAVVTHRLPLAEGVRAVEQLATGMNAQKVLLAL